MFPFGHEKFALIHVPEAQLAIAAAADDSAPHFNRAVALHMMGRVREADSSFARSAELNPKEGVIPR